MKGAKKLKGANSISPNRRHLPADTKDIISSTESLENIMTQRWSDRNFPLQNFVTKTEPKMNTRYNSTDTFSRYDGNSSARDSSKFLTLKKSQEIPRFRVLPKDDPRTKSLDLAKLGAIDKKRKFNDALRKTNQRLLKNVDFPLLTKLMQKESKNQGAPR